MPQFQNDPLPLQHWLIHQPLGLRDLLSRAQQLAEINRGLREWADEPCFAQIHVANIRHGTLVIYSSSAAALVVLRHRRKALLDFLNHRFQLACNDIEAKVRPDTNFQII